MNQSQAENIKCLLEEKTKLQTTLEAEQEALAKLRFEVTSLGTKCDCLKVRRLSSIYRLQVETTKFAEQVTVFESDKHRLEQEHKVALLGELFSLLRNFGLSSRLKPATLRTWSRRLMKETN